MVKYVRFLTAVKEPRKISASPKPFVVGPVKRRDNATARQANHQRYSRVFPYFNESGITLRKRLKYLIPLPPLWE